MQQREPHVSASHSARASSADFGSLHPSHPSAWLEADGTEYSIPLEPFGSERTSYLETQRIELPPICSEPTVDITLREVHEPTVIRPDPSPPAPEPAAAATEREITVGTVLAERYVLHRLLGTGGTCQVFLAEDLHRRLAMDAAGELLALKVLRPALRHSPHSLQRLRREFLQMQQLTHSSIARVFDLDCDGDVWFMTMELVDANNALSWMAGSYSNAEAIRLILACCEAVAYAHRKGIVHGDLKPGNVLVSSEQSVKLIDFGSVAGAGESEAAVGKLEATPQYASPAVLAGHMAEVRDDVFSLGCLAYMILARGQHPFDRKSALEAARAQMRPPYIPGVPLRMFEVVLQALDWEPALRQSSVREFQHALVTAELAALPPADRSQPQSVHAPDEAPEETQQVARLSEPAPLQGENRAAAPEPSDDYLSRFRGYVAGPMMDTKLQGVPTTPDAAEPAPAITTCAPPDSFTVDVPQPALPAERARSTAPSRRLALAAAGILLVLGSASVATLLSGQSQPAPQPRALPTARLLLPVVTIPAPSIELPAMPTVLIGRDSKSAKPARSEAPRTASKPVAAGVVSFAARDVEVSPTQNLVAITLRRSDASRGTARVGWAIEGGNAARLLDEDRAGAQVVQFNSGQRTRTLYVPLSKDAAEFVADGLRTFRVKLRKVEDGPTPGRVAEVRVTLLDR